MRSKNEITVIQFHFLARKHIITAKTAKCPHLSVHLMKIHQSIHELYEMYSEEKIPTLYSECKVYVYVIDAHITEPSTL